MNLYYFQRIDAHINKYAQRDIAVRTTTLYIGHKPMNITVGEIIRLFGIMLRISIESWNMGGYLYYFVEDPMINLGHGYSVQPRGYNAWREDVMTIIRFKHICSTFHIESMWI